MEEPFLISEDELIRIDGGGFGSIFLLKLKPLVLFKHIMTKAENHQQIFSTEWQTLKRLSHLHIVKYLGIGRFQQKMTGNWTEGILMEYCQRGSLDQLLYRPTIIYSIHTVVWWTRQLISALDCLEKNQIVHRDIKPANVFVNGDFLLMLGDFGGIKEITQTCSSFSRGIITPRYTSPEQMKNLPGSKLSFRSDIYSFGLIVFEMIERRKVFANFGAHYQYGLYPGVRQFLDVEPLECNHEIRSVVERTTIFDFRRRPYASQLFVYIEELVLRSQKEIDIHARPLENFSETRLIKPIGFDGTRRRLSVKGFDLLNADFYDCFNSQIKDLKFNHNFILDHSSEKKSTKRELLEGLKLVLENSERMCKAFERRMEDEATRRELYIEQEQRQKIQHLEEKVHELQIREKENSMKIEYYEKTLFNGRNHISNHDSAYGGSGSNEDWGYGSIPSRPASRSRPSSRNSRPRSRSKSPARMRMNSKSPIRYKRGRFFASPSPPPIPDFMKKKRKRNRIKTFLSDYFTHSEN